MDELKISVRTVRDNGATPFDADCYTPEEIQAWRNDEWHYVGVLVDVIFQGVEIGSASLWGIDSTDSAYHQEIGEDLTSEAMADAMSFLRKAQEAMEAH